MIYCYKLICATGSETVISSAVSASVTTQQMSQFMRDNQTPLRVTAGVCGVGAGALWGYKKPSPSTAKGAGGATKGSANEFDI